MGDGSVPVVGVEAEIHNDDPSEQTQRVSPRKVGQRRLLLSIRQHKLSGQSCDNEGYESALSRSKIVSLDRSANGNKV